MYISTDFRLLRRYLNERKIRFYRNSNIRKLGISIFGRVHLFPQMFPLKCTPRAPPSHRRKLEAEKVSDVAEEVSPQNAARNRDAELWDR